MGSIGIETIESAQMRKEKGTRLNLLPAQGCTKVDADWYNRFSVSSGTVVCQWLVARAAM